MSERPGRSGYAALFIGLFFVSTSGPFLVAARMDALAMVVVRMLGSAIVLLAWARARGLRLEGRHVGRTLLGAALLAAHFALWLKAFDLTDFASNLLLLVAQPVVAALLGAAVGEPPTRRTWASVALAALGLGIIARGDFSLGPRALLGDGMCIVGALAIALFYVVTRRARAETPLAPFLGAVFLAGGLFVLPLALVSGSRFGGYSSTSWAWAGALVFVTTIGGHGLLNVAARRVSLFSLNVVIVLEPAIGIGLGALMFGARVTPGQLAGGGLLAGAVWVGLLGEHRRARSVVATAPPAPDGALRTRPSPPPA